MKAEVKTAVWEDIDLLRENFWKYSTINIVIAIILTLSILFNIESLIWSSSYVRVAM